MINTLNNKLAELEKISKLKPKQFIKTAFFSFILATIPSYHGYFMKGGALQVGKASTTSFVWTSVTIIMINYLITQSLLA